MTAFKKLKTINPDFLNEEFNLLLIGYSIQLNLLQDNKTQATNELAQLYSLAKMSQYPDAMAMCQTFAAVLEIENGLDQLELMLLQQKTNQPQTEHQPPNNNQ